MNAPVNLLALELSGLEEFVRSLGEPAYRAGQLWQWLWQKGASDFQGMSNLSKALRAKLASSASIDLPEVERGQSSKDGTFKLLLKLHDGERIECVLIPERSHYTLCLSTQVGCAMGCRFCTTGGMGFTRNLDSSEILSQVLLSRTFLHERGIELALRNVVYMGMGEPLLNLDNVLHSLRVMTDPGGLSFSTRRITVSTVGIPAGLPRLGESGLAALAVSLHAPNQELRASLMPKAAKVPLNDLMTALDAYPLKPRQRITYEYIMLKDVNDSLKHARQLVALLGQRKAKVNLIAYNPGPEAVSEFSPSPMERIEEFEQYLRDKRMTVILRKSKGQDILAACGQLKASLT